MDIWLRNDQVRGHWTAAADRAGLWRRCRSPDDPEPDTGYPEPDTGYLAPDTDDLAPDTTVKNRSRN